MCFIFQAENVFLSVQGERRQRQQEMVSVQSQLKQINMDLDKVQRGDERYLKLLTGEHEILKEESKLAGQLHNFEATERQLFAELSSAVRESHEKERARSDRTKYWSIIGSIIGAMIGIFGTSINNYLRMRELRGLVKESTAGGEELQIVVGNVADTVHKQQNQMMAFIKDLKLMFGGDTASNWNLSESPSKSDDTGTPKSDDKSVVHLEVQTQNILKELHKQDELLQKELGNMKNILGVSQAEDKEGNVVYVGPQLEEILDSQNKNIEWKIKMNALWTITLIYGAFALTLPILYGIFKGG